MALLFAAGLGSPATAGVKAVAYPEVKVTVAKPYKPDAAFERMRAAFADAVAKRDVAALSALIAPMFLWTIGGQPADEMDLGRTAVHNFKVVFGFRALGKDVDGGVDGGPYWDTLAAFASDPSYYVATDAGNLICGPITAELADEDVFDQAREKIETGDDGSDWYFTLGSTSVTSEPGDKGPPAGKVGTIAMPVLGSFRKHRKASRRRSRPMWRFCCLRAKAGGFPRPRAVRCSPITFAMPGPCPETGKSPQSTSQASKTQTAPGCRIANRRKYCCADQGG